MLSYRDGSEMISRSTSRPGHTDHGRRSRPSKTSTPDAIMGRAARPHSALDYRPPAPQTIVPKRTDPAFAMDGLQPDQPYPETVPGLT